MVLVIARVQTVRISQAFKEFVKKKQKKKKQYFLSNSKENVLWIKAMTE